MECSSSGSGDVRYPIEGRLNGILSEQVPGPPDHNNELEERKALVMMHNRELVAEVEAVSTISSYNSSLSATPLHVTGTLKELGQ